MLVLVNKTHTTTSQAHTRGSRLSLEQKFPHVPHSCQSKPRKILPVPGSASRVLCSRSVSFTSRAVCLASALGISSRQVCVTSSFITREMNSLTHHLPICELVPSHPCPGAATRSDMLTPAGYCSQPGSP